MSKLYKISEYELYLISGLANGATVGELGQVLKHFDLVPSSISSIDKALKELRIKTLSRTNTELVYKFRDKIIVLNLDDIFA